MGGATQSPPNSMISTPSLSTDDQFVSQSNIEISDPILSDTDYGKSVEPMINIIKVN